MSLVSRRLAIAAVAAAAVAGGVWLYSAVRREPPPEIGGYVVAQPRPLPDVELRDEHDGAFARADFAGAWSFLYFGYTYCPDVCPLTLIELATVKQQLAAELPAERSNYYFVSVDPQRDTPERLREYVAYFDPAFRALTGTPEALTALATATSSLFYIPERQGGDNYLVNHSSNIVLLNPAGALAAVLTPPHTPAQIAADFTTIRRYYEAMR